MNIVVTGSVGFIGYHLTQRLLKENFSVIGIDNLNDYYDVGLKHSRLKKLLPHHKFKFIKQDINNIKEIENFGKIDLVINLAAQAGVRLSLNEYHKYLDSNINGFNSVLKFCVLKNIKNVIYASSSSVYGSNKDLPFSEENVLESPNSIYAATKINNEQVANIYSKKFNLNCIGLRFFTVYGPFGRPDMAYFKFASKLNAGKKIPIFNKGLNSRDMTYIDDAVDGIILAIKNIKTSKTQHEIFNIGNNFPIKTIDLLNLIEKRYGIKGKISHEEYPETVTTVADLRKSKNILGFNPKINLENGLENFLRWFDSYYNS